MATVTVIPAKPMQELKGLEATAKLRVCAYARVSTDNEEQLSSYQAQVEHYISYIQNNPAWEFCGIFADEGISGTNTKKRVEFNRMIEECMAGKIDMVITKSISRFARNTLDTLKYVRMLKDKGVAIYFEKEAVNTLDSKGEFLITLLGSLAQEESSNLSQITKMGISYRFQEGKVLVNHNKFLGYTKDEQGQLVIVPEEAATVRRIYREFLDGKSPYKIASNLQKDGIITGSGGSKWFDSTVIGILKNVKYMGDALLQKTYTVNFLTKKRVINNGHAAQYYVEDSHEGIVSKEEFAVVQAEFERRWNMRGYSKSGKSAYTSEYPLSGKLFCQNCGSKFRRLAWGSGKNKKYVWICINHQQNGNLACDQKSVKEKDFECLRWLFGLETQYDQNIN
jgi:DNA invertase Pin-like site-specific DNA recombinase